MSSNPIHVVYSIQHYVIVCQWLATQHYAIVCQWLATGRWFSLGIPVSSTNKTDCHDITELLLKVALNTITITLLLSSICCRVITNKEVFTNMLRFVYKGIRSIPDDCNKSYCSSCLNCYPRLFKKRNTERFLLHANTIYSLYIIDPCTGTAWNESWVKPFVLQLSFCWKVMSTSNFC